MVIERSADCKCDMYVDFLAFGSVGLVTVAVLFMFLLADGSILALMNTVTFPPAGMVFKFKYPFTGGHACHDPDRQLRSIQHLLIMNQDHRIGIH